MPKQKNKPKASSGTRRKLIYLFTGMGIGVLIIGALVMMVITSLRFSFDQMIVDSYNSTPGPWYECTFEFREESIQVTLKRRLLPGIFHSDYGIQVRLQRDNQEPKTILLVYTEQANTQFYQTSVVLKDGTQVAVFRIESWSGHHYVDRTDFSEISPLDIEDEAENIYLGYFDEVEEFVSEDTTIANQIGECDVLSDGQELSDS